MLAKLTQVMLEVFAALTTVSASYCLAQNVEASPSLTALQQQIDYQAAQIDELTKLLGGKQAAAASPFGAALGREDKSRMPGSVLGDPLILEKPTDVTSDNSSNASGSHPTLNFYADYDRGFVVRAFDPPKHPFELNVSGWIQFRHHAFDRDVASWTDSAGGTRLVRDRNAFDIERGRLVFSGFAVDQRLTYFLQLDGDTDGAHSVDFFDYWWGWQLTDSFQLQFGKRKVSASRQWLLGARRTRFIDRPMANDFFRPDRTVGIFGVGTIGDNGHYELMVGNGYHTANLPNLITDDRFTFAATNYFDSRGNIGGQIVDFDCTRNPLVRFGHSFVYSPNTSDAIGIPLGEADFLRLSDGTRLTQTGALAAGVTVSEYDIVFYGLDAIFKWRGWSFDSEVFMRWIDNIIADAPLPDDSLEQYGFYTEGGYFLIPKKLDVNARYSQVKGEQGTASEYAAGFNWYPLGKPQLKASFDVTVLDGSPLQNTASDILVGDDGILFRSQLQAEF
ncbi:porin [Aureliella helgolandensis]|uniref:Phosphate-selective porin O and P n=1 Tax=Aureliella helgolandensis TaxID=2527968 RepID=A0A518G3N0_9BACT|nr:porin [Aureliella helgolandensis]QDV23194.1 Phosphate-selective porin O and P [Aureliella helgolandensis]